MEDFGFYICSIILGLCIGSPIGVLAGSIIAKRRRAKKSNFPDY